MPLLYGKEGSTTRKIFGRGEKIIRGKMLSSSEKRASWRSSGGENSPCPERES